MPDSPVRDAVDEESLRELVRGLMDKVRELEGRVAQLERPSAWPIFEPHGIATMTTVTPCAVCHRLDGGPCRSSACPRLAADCPSLMTGGTA